MNCMQMILIMQIICTGMQVNGRNMQIRESSRGEFRRSWLWILGTEFSSQSI